MRKLRPITVQLPSSHGTGGIPARQLALTVRPNVSLENLSKAGEGGEMILGALWALITSVRLGEWPQHTRYQLCGGQILSQAGTAM